METTSELIQRRLREMGITKAELAKRASVSRAYIGDLANGTAKTQSGIYRPSPEIFSRLVKALEIPESEFATSLGYGQENQIDPEISIIASRLASGVMASGFNDLEDEDLREAFLEDMQSISASMLQRRITEQNKRKAKKK